MTTIVNSIKVETLAFIYNVGICRGGRSPLQLCLTVNRIDYSLEELFCDVDDFCQIFEVAWSQKLLQSGLKKRKRQRSMSLSEIMTILIEFYQKPYRTFKSYYLEQICQHWHQEFPGLVSYQRFIEWIPLSLVPLCAYLNSYFGSCTEISFIDATKKESLSLSSYESPSSLQKVSRLR
ncbi:MAG: hypothetical protein J7529_22180 [Roseofilum sp. Guam]|nr:hypothetical protein [Roseofilum sp. Guam]MBP0031078.1 hypothetical protein [Roseofilum sp. Guam]